jgi:hypothetical protein
MGSEVECSDESLFEATLPYAVFPTLPYLTLPYAVFPTLPYLTLPYAVLSHLTIP